MKYLKSITLVTIFMLCSSSSYLAQQVWVKQNSGTTKLLYMPFFTDNNNGTIVGQQGTILRTTDGGITWNSQYSTTLHSLTSVYFSDVNNGIAVGASGTVLKTEDGGETWVNQNSGFVFNFITALSFANSNVGVAVGEDGLIIKTTDGGENWFQQYSEITNWFYGVSFVNENVGTAVSFGGGIVRTTNGGATWVRQNSGTTEDLVGVFFTNVDHGTAVGYKGTILRTTDGGQTWNKQNGGTSNWLRGIYFTDVNNGIVAGENGIILQTTNGGETWVKQNSGTTSSLVGVYLADINSGTIVGFDGTILKSVDLKLNFPNGGEQLEVGTYQNITWEASNNVSAVKIEYTTDNGNTWLTIANNISASNGRYSWLIPNTPSSLCKIRISDVSNSYIKSESENNFSIFKKILILTSPNGGEVWKAGSVQNITWAKINVTNIKIEYSTDNGSNWFVIVNSTSAEGGSLYWAVPYNNSSQCKIRISDTDDQTIVDESDEIFAIYQDLLLTSPNNGEMWKGNTLQKITWISQTTEAIKIEFSTNNGNNWTTIINNISANIGYYYWKVPDITSSLCKIRISDVSNANINDESDRTFTVYKPVILVTSPNGGESLTADLNKKITWISSYVNSVKIEYTTNNGNEWITIVDGLRANTWSYNWKVPRVNSIDCKVRITDESDAEIYDESNGLFSIRTPTITVISPNGGESWHAEELKTIEWSSNLITNVRLQYTTDDGNSWITILNSISADADQYIWMVPNTVSPLCRIKISDVSNALTQDESDAAFTIAPTVGVEESENNNVPTEYMLYQNHPNPFNPTTTISYQIPNPGHVILKVYNLLGEHITTLVDEEKAIGKYNVYFNSSNLSSGVYFYLLQSRDFIQFKKMILIK